jgi:peptidyl-tRNA hydrolase
MQHLGTEDFTRIRIGIKSDEKNMADVPNFVLGKFGLLERRKVNESFLKAKEEIEKFFLQTSAPTA